MIRTIRALALASLTFSSALALYSLATVTSYPQVFAVVPQLLRTTGTALGLATAIVASVASAQARRWRLFGGLLCLAVLTPYSPYPIDWAFPLIPAFRTASELAGLQVFLLSYAVPPVATALVVLAGEELKRTSRPSLGPTGDETDGLEITPLNA